MKNTLVGVIIVAALAAVIWAIMSTPKPKRENVDALFHLTNDGQPYGDFDNLLALKNELYFPVEFGETIEFECIYDGEETPSKILPAWHVKVGKDGEGLYHKNPFDSGTRVAESSPESIKAWLSTL